MILNNEREKTIYKQGFMSGSNAAQVAIKAAERRAEVAERALLLLCDKVMRDILVMVFPSTKTQVRNKQELYDYCLKQAEKDLAEEKKDDKS